MPRPYSEEFLRFINATESKSLGVTLAKACVRANLPLIQVSRHLDVSKVTVFNWFRGRGMRENMREKVENFLQIVERDLESGVLPISSHKQAELYIVGVEGNNDAAQ